MDWSRLLNCRRAGPSDHLDGDRTEFEQDLSRVVFSTPVRRLQDKTHVFPLEPHDSVRTRLEEVASRVRARFPSLKVECFVRRGVPWDKLANVACELGAEMIVVGCRGLGGVQGLLLGSVSSGLCAIRTAR